MKGLWAWKCADMPYTRTHACSWRASALADVAIVGAGSAPGPHVPGLAVCKARRQADNKRNLQQLLTELRLTSSRGNDGSSGELWRPSHIAVTEANVSQDQPARPPECIRPPWRAPVPRTTRLSQPSQASPMWPCCQSTDPRETGCGTPPSHGYPDRRRRSLCPSTQPADHEVPTSVDRLHHALAITASQPCVAPSPCHRHCQHCAT
jgi:hypothetical protein